MGLKLKKHQIEQDDVSEQLSKAVTPRKKSKKHVEPTRKSPRKLKGKSSKKKQTPIASQDNTQDQDGTELQPEPEDLTVSSPLALAKGTEGESH